MIKDNIRNIFLILGIGNGGLFVARQLRKRWPDAIIYAVDAPDAIGQYSNTINCFSSASSEDEIVACINEVIAKANGERVKAFMCSNPMLEFIVLHHPELFGILQFENDFSLYRQIVDKSEVDKLCRSLKISRPEEYALNDLSSIHFPVVVKPLEKMNALGASKCAYIQTRGELDTYLEKMSRLSIDFKDLVCQQCVRGDNRWEYGYGGYFKDGVPIVDICFHQFRQMPQGLCCYIREMTNSSLILDIKRMVTPFLKSTCYSGYIEFDIKEDAISHIMYLLDINPRPWRSVDMLSVKLEETSVYNPHVTQRSVVWRYPFREVLSFENESNVSYCFSKSLTGKERMKTLIALSDNRDRGPFVEQLKRDCKEFIRIIKKQFFKK